MGCLRGDPWLVNARSRKRRNDGTWAIDGHAPDRFIKLSERVAMIAPYADAEHWDDRAEDTDSFIFEYEKW